MISSSTSYIAGVIICVGLFLRIYFQIVGWPYSGDEINLGLDIINHSYRDLLYPFHSRQSAPPLFLILEKFISGIAKPYVSLKILSLLSSCISILLFKRILKNSFRPIIYLILLGLFCFNPFIISNSLSLKQYTLDLTLGLIALNYFFRPTLSFKTFIFYSIFCLLSNIGLFFCAAMAIFYFIREYLKIEKGKFLKWKSLKILLAYLFAPIPYLIFFLWFMNQSGADRMQQYMVNYWEGAFMPLDVSFFYWIGIQGKVIYFFFFTTYGVIGVLMLLIFVYGILILLKNRSRIYFEEHLGFTAFFILVVVIHLILSAMKMYPFSDRLFLYIEPGIYLIFGLGLERVYSDLLLKNRVKKIAALIIFLIPVLATISFFTYLPNRKNDVVTLKNVLESENQITYFTPQARQLTLNWLNFTHYFEENDLRFLEFKEWQSNFEPKGLLVTTQNEKFGHSFKYTKPNPQVIKLLAENKIFLYKRISGFAIYKFRI